MSLEFSNNLIEFRTCVDTCAGLRDLMQYIASYGDLRDFVFAKAKSFDSCKDETESADGFSTPLGSLVRKNVCVCTWCLTHIICMSLWQSTLLTHCCVTRLL